MTIDLHGYHPSDIVWCDVLKTILKQAWEIGDERVCFIHGHGRNRGISPGFVNTNTGYFGLELRRALRHDKGLRKWIHHTTLICSDKGTTNLRLKRNPSPMRSAFDADLIPDAVIEYRGKPRF